MQVGAQQQIRYATQPTYTVKSADLGPLGPLPLLDTPYSVTVIPQQLMVNQQAQTVNQVLRNLPSVEIRDQQGLQISRPQARGFTGTVVQNTRLDGLNIIGTTAIPAENLGSIQVLNGLAGSLYGPETPAGVFNYVLKRPPDQWLLDYTQSLDSDSVLTGHLDLGGRAGADDRIGYRLNLVHGEGQSFVSGSRVNRSLASGGFDYHFDDRTTLQTNVMHYASDVTGLPGSIVYGSGSSTLLPQAIDPTRKGLLGQPGAGNDLTTDTGLTKLTHDFGNGWHFEIGGLDQVAIRNLLGITNQFTDNFGDFDVIKNFNAVSRYTIFSNLARLSGHFDLFGLHNDVSFATNGFDNGSYNYRDSIAVPLGRAKISQPVIFPVQPTPDNGGRYKSGELRQQSLIAGDTLHFNPQWAVQGVLSDSLGSSTSYAKNGAVTKSNNLNGVWNPTVSLIYTPDHALTLYSTYAHSTEVGDVAPAGTANANEFLAPFHDTQHEAGAKYAVSDNLLLTLAAFRMTRPLTSTNAATNVFAVVGTQRDDGVELFAQGGITPQLSVLGGLTYIDARLLDTGAPMTDD
ncbi:MAG: TonB-dependent receptor [Gammaproteobacteria bacterium]